MPLLTATISMGRAYAAAFTALADVLIQIADSAEERETFARWKGEAATIRAVTDQLKQLRGRLAVFDRASDAPKQ